MVEDERSYYQQRGREERMKADAATERCVRLAHEHMAFEYEQLAQRDGTIKLRVVAA